MELVPLGGWPAPRGILETSQNDRLSGQQRPLLPWGKGLAWRVGSGATGPSPPRAGILWPWAGAGRGSPSFSPQALAFLGDQRSPEQAQETLGKLLAWVRDMEDLVANQKAPSSEAKVVKAQLQEQKVSREPPPPRVPAGASGRGCGCWVPGSVPGGGVGDLG